jgi:hypothetical protein
MNKDTPYPVTEWDWFKLHLSLYSVMGRGEANPVRYMFDDESGIVTCSLFAKPAKLRQNELLELLRQRIQFERLMIYEILKTIPILSREFQIEKHVIFQILEDYGTGSTLVCSVKNNEFVWGRCFENE